MIHTITIIFSDAKPRTLTEEVEWNDDKAYRNILKKVLDDPDFPVDSEIVSMHYEQFTNKNETEALIEDFEANRGFY
jgi:hypothetical protein